MLLIVLFDELPKKINKKSFKGKNCSNWDVLCSSLVWLYLSSEVTTKSVFKKTCC